VVATNVGPNKDTFKINEHFNELMRSVGLDPSDTGGSITFVGEDPIMESRIRLGAGPMQFPTWERRRRRR
jgi:hypothetical protein